MPIYAYRCSTCGQAKDVLQKMSDPVLTICPNCGAPTFEKQVTAAGFQLKGSGWYVTDFRGDNKKPAVADDSSKTEGAKTEGDKGKTASSDSAGGSASGDSSAGSKGDAPSKAADSASGGDSSRKDAGTKGNASPSSAASTSASPTPPAPSK